ncbi:serine protease [Sphaerisporangium sp. NPDC088356]|uniref:trypsin-like serine peptidase n=1 Tax=Sphaerisporangium sp. NPDC088356 TaxID=3154871 RepID=UPI0034166801
MSTIHHPDTAKARQTDAATRRYAETTGPREANLRRRRAEGLTILDGEHQLAARAQRLLRRGDLPVAAVARVVAEGVPSGPRLLEQIIGESSELQAVNFLARGTRAAATVARISLNDGGRLLPRGTAFLVAPALLMTNNHVLANQESARDLVVEFAAEVNLDNEPAVPARFRLDPEACFLTDQHLDFTLVAVRTGPDGRRAGEVFGWNRLVAQQGKVVIGEPVNIVGHPSGRLKEISIRHNELSMQLDDFLHYTNDTEPGNSGSPVFNDQWEVVALHHSGIPRLDEQGRWIRKDGQPWAPGDGDDAVDWVANEGVRVSVILARLAQLRPAAPVQALLAEMGPAAGLTASPAWTEALGATAGTSKVSGLAGRPSAFGGTGRLVFVHGRSQEGRDPEAVRREWTAGLNKGLTLAGSPLVDPADVWLPFYGDRFHDAMTGLESAPVLAGAVTDNVAAALAPSSPTTRLLYEQLIAEAAAKARMPADSVSEGLTTPLQRMLSWLAATTNLDRFLIAKIFRDVAAYLDNPDIRRTVLDAVCETLPASGPIVLVTHSLGTVVAMDLLTRLPATLEVPLLVTAGSPLGLDSVYTRLLSGGPHSPAQVTRWLNVWSPADPVAIGCPLRDDWTGPLEEAAVDNPLERAHLIEEYLAHPAIAQAIRETLT